MLRRVGKTDLTDQVIIQQLQEVFPEKHIKRVIACKGSDRTVGPPQGLVRNEAPCRKAIIVSRIDASIRVEQDWEFWQELSNRQLIRPSHAARINVTMFAANRSSDNGRTSNGCPPAVTETAREPASHEPTHDVPETMEDRHQDSDRCSVPRTTKSQQADFRSEKHGPKFMQLSPEQKTFLIKLHQNLGHPSHARLSQVLQEQGHAPCLSQGILDMKCSTCTNEQQPKVQRTATIKDDLDFNDRIGIDGVTYTALNGTTYHFHHVIDYGTNYHVACASPGQNSQAAIEALVTGWFQWAGAPIELHTDAGTEFTSREFSSMLTQFSVRSIVAAPGAHWQIGKVERHGHILQTMLRKYEQDFPIVSYQDLQVALAQCTSSKNALSLKSGYSPDVLTFGKTLRVPESITSDYSLPSHLLAEEDTQQGIQFREKLAKREAARKAFHLPDNDANLRRAMLYRTRPHRGTYPAGTWVMIWRQTPSTRGWIGPARIIQQEGQHCIWCNHVGNLVKVSPEHVREVSALEQLDIPQTLCYSRRRGRR